MYFFREIEQLEKEILERESAEEYKSTSAALRITDRQEYDRLCREIFEDIRDIGMTDHDRNNDNITRDTERKKKEKGGKNKMEGNGKTKL